MEKKNIKVFDDIKDERKVYNKVEVDHTIMVSCVNRARSQVVWKRKVN